MVVGACLRCVEKLHFENDSRKPGLELCYPDIDSRILDLFGDSLAARLPLGCNKIQRKQTDNERKTDKPIPWQFYSLTTNMSNFTALPKRRKMNVSEVFYPQTPIRRFKSISILFGLQRRCSNKRQLKSDASNFSTSSSQLQLVRRITTTRRKRGCYGLMTWL